MRAAAALLLGLAAVAAAQEPPGPAPAEVDATAIARRADAVLHSDRTFLEATLRVSSPGQGSAREVGFRRWDDRSHDRSFLRVLSPASDAGTGFLRLPPNLWTYAPAGERTSRIPRSMLREPWMGSDFSYDDLMNESSDVDDYDHHLLRIDESPEGHPGLRAWVVEYVPHEDAPVAWGRIVSWIEVEHATPLRREYYDADGVLVRVLHFEDVRDLEGRRVPFRWIMRPVGKEGRETRVEVAEILFDPELDEAVFTTRNLRAR